MKVKLSIIALSFLVLASCKKDEPFDPPTFTNSYLHIVGASTIVDTFSVVFDYYHVDDVVIGKYFNMKNWPLSGYAELTAGGEPDEFGNGKLYLHAIKYDFPTIFDNDTLINKKPIILNPEEHSTLCLADSAGQMILLKYKDVFNNPPDSGKANVRFINLKDNLNQGALISTNGMVSISDIDFKEASSFVQVSAGLYTLQAKDSGGNVISSLSYTLYSGGTFTFFLGSNSTLGSFVN